MAKTSLIMKQQRPPKFKSRAYTPLQDLRPAARLPAEVPDVPDLLPRARAQGRGARRDQGELVGRPCTSDPIADFLTRIRNASRAEHEKVDIPSSKLKLRMAEILKDEGFIKNFRLIEDNKQGTLRVYLKYAGQREDHLRDRAGVAARDGVST